MQIYKEIALREFKPWCGAKAVFNRFTTEELDSIEDLLTEVKETWDETEINDTF